MTVDVHKGRVYSAELGRSKMDSAELRAASPVLRIEGSASGPSTDFIRYITSSPLDVTLDHPAAGIDVAGSGKLALKLELPLGKPDAIKIAGDYTLDNGRIKFADGTPPLDPLGGKILVTGHEVNAPSLTAELV